MSRIAAEVLIGVIYLAIVYVLVRPGSPAATAVKTITGALVGVVGSVTGYSQVGGTSLP